MSPPAAPRAHGRLWSQPGAPCHPSRAGASPLPSLFNGEACAGHAYGHAYSWAGPLASLRSFGEDFSKPGAGQDDCKAPREGAPLCSPTAPLPPPSQPGGTPAPCPGRAAPEVTFGGRPSPGACHHGSKGRLMGAFYYSQFCRGILPLFIMAFLPPLRERRGGNTGQGWSRLCLL